MIIRLRALFLSLYQQLSKQRFMRHYVIYSLLLSSCFFVIGCNSWLDVKPYDQISEKDLFETETGFLRLLNGVYIDMNDDALYGRTLTVEMLELLTYNYLIGDDPTYWGDYIDLKNRNFTSEYWTSRLDATWDKAYALIRNCNTLLENIDSRRTLFTGNNYNLVKGEALALRALLHFDMFRLFGPVYKINPTGKSIPYYTTTSLQIQELLPANEVIVRLLDDLKNAAQLLAEDPILTEDPLTPANTGGSSFTSYRALRLNYYAVQALLSRVYWWASANTEDENYSEYVRLAIEHAMTVINSRKFPFVDKSLVLGSPENPDRIFYTECIFSLTNTSRGLLFKNNNDPQLLPKPVLTMDPALLESPYFGGDDLYGGSTDDYRYIANWSKIGSSYYFYKYSDLPDVSLMRNTMIPMIRIGEMYLIIADLQTERADKAYWVNQLRAHRGVRSQPEDDTFRPSFVGYEYLRELYGEGQTFYYNKKNYSVIMTKFEGISEFVDASEKLYVIPLPDTETENRQ